MSRRHRIHERPRVGERLDPQPAALPERRIPTLREQVQAFIQQEVSLKAYLEGHESFEEADDFDLDDDDQELGLTEYQQMGKEGIESLEGQEDPPEPPKPPEEEDPSPPEDQPK